MNVNTQWKLKMPMFIAAIELAGLFWEQIFVPVGKGMMDKMLSFEKIKEIADRYGISIELAENGEGGYIDDVEYQILQKRISLPLSFISGMYDGLKVQRELKERLKNL